MIFKHLKRKENQMFSADQIYITLTVIYWLIAITCAVYFAVSFPEYFAWMVVGIIISACFSG